MGRGLEPGGTVTRSPLYEGLTTAPSKTPFSQQNTNPDFRWEHFKKIQKKRRSRLLSIASIPVVSIVPAFSLPREEDKIVVVSRYFQRIFAGVSPPRGGSRFAPATNNLATVSLALRIRFARSSPEPVRHLWQAWAVSHIQPSLGDLGIVRQGMGCNVLMVVMKLAIARLITPTTMLLQCLHHRG